MTMKSIINLTGKSELPARILAEIDAAEIIDIPFTARIFPEIRPTTWPSIRRMGRENVLHLTKTDDALK